MEKSADRFGLCEFVVKGYGFLCRQHVRGDLPFLQQIQRLARDMKAFGHSTRKHDHCGAVIQQLLHIGNLDARAVTGPSLAPVPFARTTREKFCVLLRLGFSFNLKPSPGNMLDSRRTIAALHHKRFASYS